MPAICVCPCLRNTRTRVCLQLASSPQLSYACVVLALGFRSLPLKCPQPTECEVCKKTTELALGWKLDVACLALAYTDGFLSARQGPGRVWCVLRSRQCWLHWAPLIFDRVPRLSLGALTSGHVQRHGHEAAVLLSMRHTYFVAIPFAG